jgi:hypothetical protein
MKDFLKTVAGIVIFIAALIGVFTALRFITRKSSVILTNTECNPPCWAGIQPNQTDSSQVYAILDKLNGVNKESITSDADENNDTLGEIDWNFQRPVEDSAGSVYFENDQVTAISLITTDTLTLNKLFKKLGQPEQYWTQVGKIEDWEYLEIILLYPAKGCLADVSFDIGYKADQVEIQGSTSVFRVTYFAPEMFQKLLKTKILIDTPAAAPIPTFHPWTGLGTIAVERK